jgi:hypothetical protein
MIFDASVSGDSWDALKEGSRVVHTHDCGCGNSGNAPRTCARLRQDVKWA